MTDHNKNILNYTCGLLTGLATNLKDKNLADALLDATEAINSVLESEKERTKGG